MSKIYKNQTALQFTFSTGADITGQTDTVLLITYPGGTSATWTCTVSDESTGAFAFTNFTSGSLKTVGSYSLQPKVAFSDDTIAYGTTSDFRVFDLGE